MASDAKRYRKTATITALQWFKMGDHPAVVPLVPTQRNPLNPSYILPNQNPPPNVSLNQQDYMPGMERTHGYIRTLEGGHIVSPGDWIATGVEGEHWPIKPDIFAKSYTEETASGAASRDGEVGRLRDELDRIAKAEGYIPSLRDTHRWYKPVPSVTEALRAASEAFGGAASALAPGNGGEGEKK